MAPWHIAWPRRSGSRPAAAAFLAVFVLGVCCYAPGAGAAPYTPAGDNVVLATIAAPALAQRDTIRSLSAAVRADPSRSEDVARLASLYIELHANTGDPRYLGYAGTALGRFVGTPTTRLRLLQARLAQAEHRFDDAGTLLAALVVEQPDNAAGLLLTTSLSTLQGDYAAARRSCAALALAGRDDLATLCAADLASLAGRSSEALRQVDALLPQIFEPEVASWARQIAADIALRLDKPALAAAHARQALVSQPTLYNTILLADVLIHSGELRDAYALLNKAPQSDAVLLRRARVAHALGAAEADRLVAVAAQRIDNLRRRGDTRHAREEAYFELYLAGRADAALTASARNWQTQRERIDAELYLAAAVEAGDAQAAAPMLDWLKANASDDQPLLALARRLQ